MPNKKVLVAVTEWGYWGEELVAPLEVLDAHGYKTVFVTPKGQRPHALPPSMEVGFLDPALFKVVTDEHFARATRAVEQSNRLDNPTNLSQWFPERPFFNQPDFGHALEAYYEKRAKAWDDLKDYDALLIVGGSGAIVDLANNQRMHDVILGFYDQGKLIAAECYGVPALAWAREWTDRKSIIWGKHVTGHALEYDWKDGTGYLGVDANFGTAPYPLEHVLRDATGPDGQYHGGVGHLESTILDYPFLTGRSTQDSHRVGELMIQAIENGARRYGW